VPEVFEDDCLEDTRRSREPSYTGAGVRGAEIQDAVLLVASCSADLHSMWTGFAATAGCRLTPDVHNFLFHKYEFMAEMLKNPPPVAPLAAASLLTASPSPDASNDLALRLLKTGHEQSMRHLPTASAILKHSDEPEHLASVNWILRATSCFSIPDEVACSAVLLFDRYCAACQGRKAPESLSVVALACISTALKVHGEIGNRPWWDSIRHCLHRVLQQLCHGNLSAREIFAAENQVLRVLGFCVTSPSPLELVDALLGRLGGAFDSDKTRKSRLRLLAAFLVQLSLADVWLQYRYPHMTLAASAISIALQCFGVDAHHDAHAELLRLVSASTHLCEDPYP